MADVTVREAEILELGLRAATWLAVASGHPDFMLAAHILRARPPRPRIKPSQGNA